MDYEVEKEIIKILSKDIIPKELCKSNVVDLTFKITDNYNLQLLGNISELHRLRDFKNFKIYSKRENGDLIYILRIELED